MIQFYERKPSPERKEFHAVANTMHIPVLEFDREFLLVYANPAALSLLKISEEKLNEGVHVVDLVIPEQHDLVHEGLSLLDFFKTELDKISEISEVETFVVYQSHNLRIPYIL